MIWSCECEFGLPRSRKLEAAPNRSIRCEAVAHRARMTSGEMSVPTIEGILPVGGA